MRQAWTGGRRRRSALAAMAVASGLALGSSVVPGARLEVQDWDCPPAPTSCARPVAVAGFPVPYLADVNGLSPGGSATLAGALLGVDRFHPAAFLANVAVYATATLGLVALRERARRRR